MFKFRNPFRHRDRWHRIIEIPEVKLQHTVNVVHKHMPRPMPGQCEIAFTTRKGESYRQPGFHMTGQAFQRFNIPPYSHENDPWSHVELRFWYDA